MRLKTEFGTQVRLTGEREEVQKMRPTVEVGRETRDKIQLAMDAMLSVREASSSGIRPFRGIREAYAYCTGDWDMKLVDRGGMYRVSEAVATTDFPNVLLNSMTKKLIQDYAELAIVDQLDMLYSKA